MNLDTLIQTLTKRIATLSQRLTHAQTTGDLPQIVEIEQEIADANLAIEKLKG